MNTKEEYPKVECSNCGRKVDKEELITVEVSRQTHWNPAEYEGFCDYCIPNKYKNKFPNRYWNGL